jgi:folate-binding protein YgfZ
MPFARLTDRAVIAVGGKDAVPFLQGLVTNALDGIGPGRLVYSALLTPQGKIVFDFFLAHDPFGVLIDVAAAKAEELLQRLKLYRLRAAVTLEPRSDLAVFAAWGGDTLEGGIVDPRLPALGQRLIAAPAAPGEAASMDAYTDHRLALGVPDSADVEGQFPLDANFEELHGVDFKKGCFVGQEVTARMKHKAQPRRRLVPVTVDGDVPPPGTKLTDAAGVEIGELATGRGQAALASVRLDRLREAGALTAAGRAATVQPAGYALPL